MLFFFVTHYHCSQWTLVAFPTTWHCVGMRRTAWKTARCLGDCDGLDVGWRAIYSDLSRGHPKWWLRKVRTPVEMVHSGLSIAALRRKLGKMVVK